MKTKAELYIDVIVASIRRVKFPANGVAHGAIDDANLVMKEFDKKFPDYEEKLKNEVDNMK